MNRHQVWPAGTLLRPADAPQVVGSSADWGRLIVEGLFYASIGSRVFGNQLGVLQFAGLSGAMILSSGLICMVLMFFRQEWPPLSIGFALLIVVLAVVTDLAILENINSDMVFWISTLLMVCFIVADDNAVMRLTLFLAVCVLGSVAAGAVFETERIGIFRLSLSRGGTGSMFANANDLAQIASVSAVILLFVSLNKQLILKTLLYGVTLCLFAVTVLTLSRQGIILLAAGVALYCLALLLNRKRLIEIILIAAAVSVIAFYGAEHLDGIIEGYKFRFTQDSGRLAYWTHALTDMAGTLFSGRGSDDAYAYDGSLPHSTFLWLHLAFGGACAWIYALWVGWLGWRTCLFVLATQSAWTVRIEVLTVFAMFFAAQFTTVFAPGNYVFILSVALLEKRFAALPDSGRTVDPAEGRTGGTI